MRLAILVSTAALAMTAASGSFAAGGSHGYNSDAGNSNGDNGNHYGYGIGNGLGAAGNNGNHFGSDGNSGAHNGSDGGSGSSGPLVLPMPGQGGGVPPVVVMPNLLEPGTAGEVVASCQGGDVCEFGDSAISAVPLPEGGVLLAAGLIGLIGVRRMRKRG